MTVSLNVAMYKQMVRLNTDVEDKVFKLMTIEAKPLVSVDLF